MLFSFHYAEGSTAPTAGTCRRFLQRPQQRGPVLQGLLLVDLAGSMLQHVTVCYIMLYCVEESLGTFCDLRTSDICKALWAGPACNILQPTTRHT